MGAPRQAAAAPRLAAARALNARMFLVAQGRCVQQHSRSAWSPVKFAEALASAMRLAAATCSATGSLEMARWAVAITSGLRRITPRLCEEPSAAPPILQIATGIGSMAG